MTSEARLRRRLSKIMKSARRPEIMAAMAGANHSNDLEHERTTAHLAGLADEINELIRDVADDDSSVLDGKGVGSTRRSPGRDAIRRDANVLLRQIAFARDRNDSLNTMELGRHIVEQANELRQSFEPYRTIEIHRILTGSEAVKQNLLPGPLLAGLIFVVALIQHTVKKRRESNSSK